MVNKFGGNLWQAQYDHSPLDVVAWHGSYAPYKYDTRDFMVIGSISYDHPDPSIFTVLTSPTDTPGLANVDFVVFAPRWLVGENTFRPPWFHRNVMSEYMGLVSGAYDAKATGFTPGGGSLHNTFASHGPDADTYAKASTAELAPQKLDDTLAFMFESRWTILPTRQAMDAPSRQPDYDEVWAGLTAQFPLSPARPNPNPNPNRRYWPVSTARPLLRCSSRMSVTSRLSIASASAMAASMSFRAATSSRPSNGAPSPTAGLQRQPVVVVHQPVAVHPGPDLEVRLPGSLGRVLHPLGRARDQPGLRLQPAGRIMRVEEVPELVRILAQRARHQVATLPLTTEHARDRFHVGGVLAFPALPFARRLQRGQGGRPGGLDGLLGGQPGVPRAGYRAHHGARDADRSDPARDRGGGDDWVHVGHASV